MARTRLTQLQENFSKTTDANGWTKYDYGNFQKYCKRVTFSQTISGAVVLSLSSTNLPVGISTLSTNFLKYNYAVTGNAYDLSIVFEGSSAATALNFTTRTISGTATAYNGLIDVELTTP